MSLSFYSKSNVCWIKKIFFIVVSCCGGKSPRGRTSFSTIFFTLLTSLDPKHLFFVYSSLFLLLFLLLVVVYRKWYTVSDPIWNVCKTVSWYWYFDTWPLIGIKCLLRRLLVPPILWTRFILLINHPYPKFGSDLDFG